jgi:hypothetical protein
VAFVDDEANLGEERVIFVNLTSMTLTFAKPVDPFGMGRLIEIFSIRHQFMCANLSSDFSISISSTLFLQYFTFAKIS